MCTRHSLHTHARARASTHTHAHTNTRTLFPSNRYLYDGISNGEQGQIASTRVYLETPIGVYLDSQVAQDTWRDDLWMNQLIARDPSAISAYHMPRPNHPHCYEIT